MRVKKLVYERLGSEYFTLFPLSFLEICILYVKAGDSRENDDEACHGWISDRTQHLSAHLMKLSLLDLFKVIGGLVTISPFKTKLSRLLH